MRRIDGISSSQRQIEYLKRQIKTLEAHKCKPCILHPRGNTNFYPQTTGYISTTASKDYNRGMAI